MIALAAVAGTLMAGCDTAPPPNEHGVPAADRALVLDYFHQLSVAARQDWRSEQAFLDATQHPDFLGSTCSLGGMTLEITPSISTLRPDPDWHAGEGGVRPRGKVYVIAVELVARDGQQRVGSQIGSQHVVVLDGRVYGFAPCPR